MSSLAIEPEHVGLLIKEGCVRLRAVGIDATSWIWTSSDPDQVDFSEPTSSETLVTLATPGEYEITVVATANGEQTAKKRLTVTPLDAEIVDPVPGIVFESISLEAQDPIENAEYEWSGPPVLNLFDADGATARASSESTGSFQVHLEVSAETTDYREPTRRKRVQNRATALVHFAPRPPLEPPVAVAVEEWAKKQSEARLTVLTSVQEAARRWEAAIGGLIGLFGAVVFITGPSTFEKLPSPVGLSSALTGFFAFMFALGAMVEAALAGHAAPSFRGPLSPGQYELNTWEQARVARGRLTTARVFTGLAVLLVVIGTIVAWTSSQIPVGASQSAMYVATSVDGAVVCGALTKTNGDVLVDGRVVATSDLTTVDACGPGNEPSPAYVSTTQARGIAIVALVVAVAVFVTVVYLVSQDRSRNEPEHNARSNRIAVAALVIAAVALTVDVFQFGSQANADLLAERRAANRVVLYGPNPSISGDGGCDEHLLPSEMDSVERHFAEEDSPDGFTVEALNKVTAKCNWIAAVPPQNPDGQG